MRNLVQYDPTKHKGKKVYELVSEKTDQYVVVRLREVTDLETLNLLEELGEVHPLFFVEE